MSHAPSTLSKRCLAMNVSTPLSPADRQLLGIGHDFDRIDRPASEPIDRIEHLERARPDRAHRLAVQPTTTIRRAGFGGTVVMRPPTMPPRGNVSQAFRRSPWADCSARSAGPLRLACSARSASSAPVFGVCSARSACSAARLRGLFRALRVFRGLSSVSVPRDRAFRGLSSASIPRAPRVPRPVFGVCSACSAYSAACLRRLFRVLRVFRGLSSVSVPCAPARSAACLRCLFGCSARSAACLRCLVRVIRCSAACFDVCSACSACSAARGPRPAARGRYRRIAVGKRRLPASIQSAAP